jgi:hypothetical protein
VSVRHTCIEPVRRDVALDVVDGDERQAARESEAARRVQADEQRAGQPGAGGHGDGVEVVPPTGGLGERLPDDRHDRGEMGARGHLRYDAAGGRVQAALARHHGRVDGEESPAVGVALPGDDGGGRLVAGGLHPEDAHGRHTSSVRGPPVTAAGRGATVPPGHRAIGPSGHRAIGPSGHRAIGPSGSPSEA